ncbi:hypothetical protein GJQ55_04945 [Venatoribacter cucullus]|uniref:Polysaccharide chain length determinant N-terminal domain-containing protein n=2 Tax=Venatoribacter cucullus TaxID=2661630 RepID=A0A9X7YNQ1_9GAMM|nr:hypothetical protein GJQ55_04945 [Venatoribacter cucullus]
MEPMNQGQYNHAADEIDLFDLIDDIKEKWYWLIGTGLVSVVLAGLYAFMATPTFQTEVVYKPVTEAELLPLNQPRLKDVFDIAADKSYMTAEQAFKDVRAQALSGSLLREFYNLLLSEKDPQLLPLIFNEKISPEQNFSKFTERFSSVDPGAKQNDVFLRLKFELSDAALASAVLNRYSDFMLQKHRDETREAVSMRIEAKLDQWRIQADEMRTKYLAEKERRLLTLEEAAAVAASINQQRPLYDAERVSVGAQPPLYMMGEKALRSEITQLKGRAQRGEDAYIAGLPELLWKIKTVEETQIAWNRVKYIQLDQSAIVPLSAIKPRKLLVLALGAVAGGMAGIMFALMAAAQVRRRQRKLNEKARS